MRQSLVAAGPWAGGAAAAGAAGGRLQARILRGTPAFASLRSEWEAAIARMARPSLFVTPEFLEMSWRHLGEAGDEPWFVVVREAGVLVGLLPLVLSRERSARLPTKVLRHMGMLAGDRPGLVHTVDPSTVWKAAMNALAECRSEWQLLDLREVDPQTWPDLDQTLEAVFGRRGLRHSVQVDTYAGYLPIEGDWTAYMATRSRNTRQGYQRRERILREAHPDLRIEVIDDPQRIAAAFDRYLAVEAKGWKSEAAVGLWTDPRDPAFHRELLPMLARSGRASVWLLKVSEDDIAGLVRMRQGPVMYERHSAFDPAYARHSPSTYLCMQAVRDLYGSDCDESDVMGMHEPIEQRPSIHSWYPGVRVTRRVRVVNPPLYLRPLLWLRAVLRRLRPSKPADPA